MNFFRKNERITLFAQFTSQTLKVRGSVTLDLPLERDTQGNLTDACIDSCSEDILAKLPPQTVVGKIYCAIPSRGVSLRALQLPKVSQEQIQQLVPFQIEKCFPLSADELTWIACPPEGSATEDGLDFSILALRRRTLDRYHNVFEKLNAPVRWSLSLPGLTNVENRTVDDGFHLRIGSHETEWVRFENKRPVQLGVISLGYQQESNLGTSLAKELQALQNLTQEPPTIHLTSGAAGVEKINPLLPSITQSGSFHLTELKAFDFPEWLSLQEAPEKVIHGFHYITGEAGVVRSAKREMYLWSGVALGLFLLVLIMPLARPFLKYSGLERDYNNLLEQKENLPNIKRELEFLQLLEANRAPYLDAIHVLSRTSPSGTQINQLNMNRRGNVSFEGESRDPDHVEELRSSLIESGFFYPVVVDEQTPDERGRKVTFRITAKWKSDSQRKALPKDWMKAPESSSRRSSGRGSWRGRR